MNKRTTAELDFVKSSYSGGNGNCVGVACTPEFTAIQDTQTPRAGHLEFPQAELATLLSRAKREAE